MINKTLKSLLRENVSERIQALELRCGSIKEKVFVPKKVGLKEDLKINENLDTFAIIELLPFTDEYIQSFVDDDGISVDDLFRTVQDVYLTFTNTNAAAVFLSEKGLEKYEIRL